MHSISPTAAKNSPIIGISMQGLKKGCIYGLTVLYKDFQGRKTKFAFSIPEVFLLSPSMSVTPRSPK